MTLEQQRAIVLARARARAAQSSGGNPESQSMTLPANAGLANLGATVLGLPMETVKNVANLGIAGYGAVSGSMGGVPPDLISHVPGDISNVKQMLRATGEPGLSPDNPAPKSPISLNPLNPTTQYEFMSRGGFIPGAAIPAAGSIVGEKLGGPKWAGVGALAPGAALRSYNAVRAPSLSAQAKRNAVRDQTLREGQRSGYVIPGSEINRTGPLGWLNRRLESFGGKAAIKQEAALRNSEKTNELVRQEAGLRPNQAISETAINAAKKIASQPYKAIAKISPEAAAALEDWKAANFEANLQWNFFKRQGNPQGFKDWQAAKNQAAAALDRIETIATSTPNVGKQAIAELKQARVQLAKLHQIEDSVNFATGGVSPSVIGSAYAKGSPLSGNLLTVGKFQQAFPKFMQDAERVPAPGVSALEPLAMGGFGMGGAALAGAPGAWLGAGVPLLRGPIRSGLLSGPWQRLMTPSYEPAINAPTDQAALLRAILSQQQENQK